MDPTDTNIPPTPQVPRLAEVRALILEACGPAVADFGITPENAPADLDLRGSGMIDSLGFVEVIVELEEKLEVELDLEDMDPEQITVLDPLASYIVGKLQVQARSRG